MKALALQKFAASFAVLACLSLPAQADMQVTFVGNNGVMLNAGGQSVLIDSLFNHSDNFWTRLSNADRTKLFSAAEPFDNVRWSLTTHNHPDHHSAPIVGVFSGASPQTEFILPPQARGSLGNNPAVLDVTVPFQTGSQVFTSPGIEIEVFHMEHFDQFGNDFSRVQDYTYLVTMGGVKLLHLGDVDYIPENFAAFDFPSRGIDAVVLPTFNTLISEANRDVILASVAPETIIATHLRAGQLATETANVRALYPDATIFTQPLVDSLTLVGVPEPTSLMVCLAGIGAMIARRSRRRV